MTEENSSADAPSVDALIGTTPDGTHRIERLLSRGGMASVYEARQLRLDRRVAVKVMSSQLDAGLEAVERFRREARITSGLGHPHIVQVIDFSTTADGAPFLVMELLEGEDLAHRLARVGHLPASDVARIVRQVASALAAAHAKGIVHRDLKPGNIFLVAIPDEPDFAKVLDFGISKVKADAKAITGSQAVLGTPFYMSPEQARGKNEEIDESTDQWALACIAWECLSGQNPFLGDDIAAVLYRIVHQPLPPFGPKANELSPRVTAVLSRALSKDKARRYEKVTDFAAELSSALTEVKPPAPVEPVVKTAPLWAGTRVVPAAAAGGAKKKPAQRKAASIALAGVVLIVAASAAYRFWPATQRTAGKLTVTSATTSEPAVMDAEAPQTAHAAASPEAAPEPSVPSKEPSFGRSTDRTKATARSQTRRKALRSPHKPKLGSKEDPWRVD